MLRHAAYPRMIGAVMSGTGVAVCAWRKFRNSQDAGS